jgi:ABC-type antimicrobial peptide transport system ATPase subunit
MRYLDSHPAIDTVVLAARCTTEREGTMFDNQKGGNEGHVVRYMQPTGGEIQAGDSEARMGSVSVVVQKNIRSLLNRGKKVVMIYQFPEAGWDVPVNLSREMYFGIKRTIDLSSDAMVNTLRNAHSDAMLDNVGLHPNLLRIKLADLSCKTLQPVRCLVQMQGRPLCINDDHVSQLGASMIAACLSTVVSLRR